MAFCINCGEKLHDGARFCAICGTAAIGANSNTREQKGSEYFEKHFTYTLLEYFNLSYDPIKILEREQYWKRCLDTIKNGYNDN